MKQLILTRAADTASIMCRDALDRDLTRWLQQVLALDLGDPA